MGVREIVRIDETLCDGCGECVPSCAEGALAVIGGKARLVSEAACDGLGACLGRCPRRAISVVPAVEAPDRGHAFPPAETAPRGCTLPVLAGDDAPGEGSEGRAAIPARAGIALPRAVSELRQWPVQLHLISPAAPFFRAADVLLAADCVAYAVGDFHASLLAGRALAIACPKLDGGQQRYIDTLAGLIDGAEIASLTVAVMEVPCCRGLVRLAQAACERARRKIEPSSVVVDVRGAVHRQRTGA